MASTGATKELAQRMALDLLSRTPEGMTATQLGAALWPGRAKTHLPAGAVVYRMRLEGWVTRSAAGVVQITEVGADRLAVLLEQAASA